MKLLFDQNLSPKLVLDFDGYFEEVRHVSDLNLDRVEDIKVLEYAKSNNFAIVTKDSDFSDIVSILGFHLKLFGSEWAIVRLRTSLFYLKRISTRSEHLAMMKSMAY